MRPYLLVDFGSTYTKMTAVDLDGPAVLGTAAAPTTMDDGLINVIPRLLGADRENRAA